MLTTSDSAGYAYRRNLPHLRGAGGAYMVTWRLHKSQVPLTEPERTVVASALRHFDGSRYALLAWVVMDDHVHAVAHVHDGWTLEAIMHSWKSYTAHVLQRDHGRLGSVWLEEYYDRLIRDETDLREKMRYVVTNPERRWPGAGDYAWAWCLGMDGQDA